MGLENVVHRLATQDAGVAEVLRERADSMRGGRHAGVAEVVQRFSKTSASPSRVSAEGCEGHAEVAEVSHSLTRARAHARAPARARTAGIDAGPLQPLQPLQVPEAATLLKHCRCADCVRSRAPVGSSLACPLPCVCRPERDEWHYCAEYHGPQISKDVWAWPRHRRAEVAEVSGGAPGPSDGPPEKNRRENGAGAGFFRSAARPPGQEVHQP